MSSSFIVGKDKEQELRIMFTKEDMKKAWLVQEFIEEAKLEGKLKGRLRSRLRGLQEASCPLGGY